VNEEWRAMYSLPVLRWFVLE